MDGSKYKYEFAGFSLDFGKQQLLKLQLKLGTVSSTDYGKNRQHFVPKCWRFPRKAPGSKPANRANDLKYRKPPYRIPGTGVFSTISSAASYSPTGSPLQY
ncbi:hypothetical protein AB0D57_41010, partial [Streptomyces sp. NPDC048275]